MSKELPRDDPKMRRPNIDAAKRLLEPWRPQVSLVDGLKRTIQYFEQEIARGALKSSVA